MDREETIVRTSLCPNALTTFKLSRIEIKYKMQSTHAH